MVFWGCLVLAPNHRAQHKSWRVILLWANLTNQLGWDQYFLSLCLLTRVSQWEHWTEVKTVNKAGPLVDGVRGRLKNIKVPSNHFISSCISELLQWRDTGYTKQGDHHHPVQRQRLWNNCLQLSKEARKSIHIFTQSTWWSRQSQLATRPHNVLVFSALLTVLCGYSSRYIFLLQSTQIQAKLPVHYLWPC